MIQLKKGSLEARIAESLGCRVVEKSALAKSLRVKESVLDESLKKLSLMGLVGLDALPDKTFVRLLRDDHAIYGVKPTQKRGLVKGRRRVKPREYEGVMFR